MEGATRVTWYAAADWSGNGAGYGTRPVAAPTAAVEALVCSDAVPPFTTVCLEEGTAAAHDADDLDDVAFAAAAASARETRRLRRRWRAGAVASAALCAAALAFAPAPAAPAAAAAWPASYHALPRPVAPELRPR